jgi:putative ABC transport system permease protein
MSLWSRIANVFRGERVNRELDEEFASHLEEAIGAGRDPEEARRALGSSLRLREKSRQFQVAESLDSLRADIVFGWRQLVKHKITTAAAVLSLGLGIGACTGAFRLVDALFLRPLPISHPENLYAVSYRGLNGRGVPAKWDTSSYPLFLQMREAVKGQAELVEAEYSYRTDLTYGSYQQIEPVTLGPVSGEFFSSMGLQPALGRLITNEDDSMSRPRAVAVLSYDYWRRRFAGDPKVVGKTFTLNNQLFEIVGVGSSGFTGTEPGTLVDVFVPTLISSSAADPNDASQRSFVRPERGVDIASLTSKLDAVYYHSEHERAKGWTNLPKYLWEGWPNAHLSLKPAAGGASELQSEYGPALKALGILVGLVLLIACANVANLMTSQAASRAREMALRVSLGARRARLVRLVMIESVMTGLMASALGFLFAWWAAPFVVARINSASNPIQLVLQPDRAVTAFGFALTLGVILLFGLMPALRASSVKPSLALKGGDEPHEQGRKMYLLIASQIAFCFVVLFIAGLFTTTFRRLSNRPLGFDSGRVLTIPTNSELPQSLARWNALEERVRAVPGVKSAAMSEWALLGGLSENNFISVPGRSRVEVLAYFLNVTPGWRATMGIPLLDGRDMRESDVQGSTAIVNETFVKTYFEGSSPVGRTFLAGTQKPVTIVGVVGDAVYKALREPTLPQVYEPMLATSKDGTLQNLRSATLVVRTERIEPGSLVQSLRTTIEADPTFRVSRMQTQDELVSAQTIRERMLATLALFFAGVALLLAAIGLYGVLSYSVLQRQREFGIRIAIGARVGSVAQLVTSRVFLMVVTGEILGLALGNLASRTMGSLLFEVKGNELSMLVLPTSVLFGVALFSALPAVVRAMRIDPVVMLRSE